MNRTILIADDEKEIVELLKLYIEKDGYTVLEAYTGTEALRLLECHPVDLAVIDIMMPEQNGYEVVRTLRKKHQIPVIFLSAKSQDNDKILGLGLGADDYIAKPFNPLEVAARIQAQLRRYDLWNHAKLQETRNVIEIGSLRLDKDSCAASRGGEDLGLTSTEYKLLCYFMDHAGRVLTKKQIFENVWGDFYVDDNTIMVHISKLRDKLESDPKKPAYLKTIRGLGYKFEKRVTPDEA